MVGQQRQARRQDHMEGASIIASIAWLSGSIARPRSRWKGVSYCRDCRDCPNHMVDRTFRRPVLPPRLLSRDWGCNWGRAQAAEGNRFDKIQKSFCDPDLWIYPRYDHTLNSMLKIFNPDGVLNAGGLDLLGGRRLTAEPPVTGAGNLGRLGCNRRCWLRSMPTLDRIHFHFPNWVNWVPIGCE